MTVMAGWRISTTEEKSLCGYRRKYQSGGDIFRRPVAYVRRAGLWPRISENILAHGEISDKK